MRPLSRWPLMTYNYLISSMMLATAARCNSPANDSTPLPPAAGMSQAKAEQTRRTGVAALPTAAGAVFAFCLAACSPQPAEAPDPALAVEKEGAPQTPAQALQPAPTPPGPEAVPASANVLTREGLGVLKIGETVPAGSGWAERGAQIAGPCRTVSSPDFPGVYAIVEEDKVRRITIGERSKLKLAQGIGAGASEAEVRAAFPSFREEPHKYVEPPGL